MFEGFEVVDVNSFFSEEVYSFLEFSFFDEKLGGPEVFSVCGVAGVKDVFWSRRGV